MSDPEDVQASNLNAPLFELYTRIGADYTDARQRFGSEKTIERFIRRFVEDRTFENLKSAYDSKDEKAIYYEICEFAEICGSLSLNRLSETAGVIMEAYRPANVLNRETFHVNDLFDTLFQQYYRTIEAIKETLEFNEDIE